MAIWVRLEGELPPILVPITPEVPAGQALATAVGTWERDPAGYRLLFGDQVLDEPERTLGDYGISDDEILVLDGGG